MKTELKIRTAVPEDAEKLLAIYAPYVEKTAITFEFTVPSLEEFRKRMEKTLEKYPYYVALEDTEIVGYAYAGEFKGRPAYDWSVETSIYIKEEKRRCGIGNRLYEALEETLAKQGILNVNACIAYPGQENDPYLTKDSVEFHERQGYKMVGRFHSCGYKCQRWYDMIWMEKQIGKHEIPPKNVVWFSKME